MTARRACVFCGSKPGDSPRFLEAATALGRALAARQLELVYGGAAHGLMGAVADAVLAGGQRVIGVFPRGLARVEFAHPRLSEARQVDSMAERKALMGELSHLTVTLPGGFGTMDELFEELTGAQLGLHERPLGLLDVDGYYAPLLAWVSNGLDRGFVPRALEHALLVDTDADRLVERLLSHRVPAPPTRWIRS